MPKWLCSFVSFSQQEKRYLKVKSTFLWHIPWWEDLGIISVFIPQGVNLWQRQNKMVWNFDQKGVVVWFNIGENATASFVVFNIYVAYTALFFKPFNKPANRFIIWLCCLHFLVVLLHSWAALLNGDHSWSNGELTFLGSTRATFNFDQISFFKVLSKQFKIMVIMASWSKNLNLPLIVHKINKDKLCTNDSQVRDSSAEGHLSVLKERVSGDALVLVVGNEFLECVSL